MRNYPFGERLRELRQRSGFSRKELGTHLGVTEGQIGHLETGTRGISVADAAKLAKALGVTLEELVPLDEQGLFVEPQEVEPQPVP